MRTNLRFEQPIGYPFARVSDGELEALFDHENSFNRSNTRVVTELENSLRLMASLCQRINSELNNRPDVCELHQKIEQLINSL